MGEGPSEGVGEAAGSLFYEAVVAFGAYARDHLVFVCKLQQEIEILRVRLEVGVDIAEPRREAVVEAGFQRSAKAGVVLKRDVEKNLMP